MNSLNLRFNLSLKIVAFNSFFLRIFLIILCSIFPLCSFLVRAEPQEQASSANKNLYLRTNLVISNWMSSVGEGIDLFLIGDRYSPQQNETHLRLISGVFLNDTWDLKSNLGAAFNLHLPHLQEYWNLKFTSYDEYKDRGVKKNIPGEELPERYGASLVFLRTLGNIKVNYEPRLELAKQFGVSHSLSAELLQPLIREYTLNSKTELFARYDRGPGIYQALNLIRPLSENHHLILVNQAEFFDEKNELQVTQGISHTHAFPDIKAQINYLFLLEFNNLAGYHLERYFYTAIFNQVIYEQALEYSVAPIISFPRARGFAGSPGIGASLTLIF